MLNRKEQETVAQETLQRLDAMSRSAKEHLDSIVGALDEATKILSAFTPEVQNYGRIVVQTKVEYGNAVLDILRSTRELGVIAGQAQNLHHLMDAIKKLDTVLTPDLVERLRLLTAPITVVQTPPEKEEA